MAKAICLFFYILMRAHLRYCMSVELVASVKKRGVGIEIIPDEHQ